MVETASRRPSRAAASADGSQPLAPRSPMARHRKLPVAERQPAQRARRTNNPFAGIDRLTPHGRRVADLARAYLRALGSPDDTALQSDAIAAAELMVLAEKARANALSMPGAFDIDGLTKLQNLAARAVRKLGIKPAAKKAHGLFDAIEQSRREREAAEAVHD